MNVGKAIHTVREARGLSAKELAEKADISVNYLSLLERGERSSPALMNVSAVAEALHFPLPLLLFLAMTPDERDAALPRAVGEKLAALVLDLLRD